MENAKQWKILANLLLVFLFANNFMKVQTHPPEADFSYADPDSWKDTYPTCGGKQQSPINIYTGQLESNDKIKPLVLYNYHITPSSAVLKNTGHRPMLMVNYTGYMRPWLSGGPLDGDFVFDSLHFHFGVNPYFGSEHILNNNQYAMEMHMMHYKSNFNSLQEALKVPGSVVNFAHIFMVNPRGTEGLTEIVKSLPNITEPKSSTPIDPFPLTQFNLQPKRSLMVTYEGSITIPPCNEGVIWIVSLAGHGLSEDEVNAFKALKLDHGDDHNNRPPQASNNRIVYTIPSKRR